MQKKILIIALLMVLIIFLIINTNITEQQPISGEIIRYAEKENSVKDNNLIKEDIEENETYINESVEEEPSLQIKILDYEPLEVISFQTFDVIMGPKDIRQAIILYDLDFSDLELFEEHRRLSVTDAQTVINYHTESLKGYDELKKFLNEEDIILLICHESDNIEKLKDIRRATGVSIIMKMADGGRRAKTSEDL